MPEKLLHAFADAFNGHDVEALLRMVTEDCVFDMSAGPEPCLNRRDSRSSRAATCGRYRSAARNLPGVMPVSRRKM